VKRTISAAVLAAAALTGVTVPASAAPALTTSVAPITCHPYEDSCVVDYIGTGIAGLGGYWMANNGAKWVRLTMVPGWTTSGVAPISCPQEDSCMIDFVGVTEGGGHAYWRAAQQSHGVRTSVWVTLTL
jgi:hypothetical protein